MIGMSNTVKNRHLTVIFRDVGSISKLNLYSFLVAMSKGYCGNEYKFTTPWIRINNTYIIILYLKFDTIRPVR